MSDPVLAAQLLAVTIEPIAEAVAFVGICAIAGIALVVVMAHAVRFLSNRGILP